MKAVGVRELKAHLSRYLREVRAGEVILVTDRQRVVAELRAPGSSGLEESDTDRGLRRLAEAGGLRVTHIALLQSRHRPAPRGLCWTRSEESRDLIRREQRGAGLAAG
jgi:antitoxin (DNA-binding transcriptional repressor) of toxin-antitoxin stability system